MSEETGLQTWVIVFSVHLEKVLVTLLFPPLCNSAPVFALVLLQTYSVMFFMQLKSENDVLGVRRLANH